MMWMPSPRGDRITADVSAHGPGNGREAWRGVVLSLKTTNPGLAGVRHPFFWQHLQLTSGPTVPTPDRGDQRRSAGKSEVVRRNTSTFSTRPPATGCERRTPARAFAMHDRQAADPPGLDGPLGFAFLVFPICSISLDEGRSGRDKVGHAGAAEAFPWLCSFWRRLPVNSTRFQSSTGNG